MIAHLTFDQLTMKFSFKSNIGYPVFEKENADLSQKMLRLARLLGKKISIVALLTDRKVTEWGLVIPANTTVCIWDDYKYQKFGEKDKSVIILSGTLERLVDKDLTAQHVFISRDYEQSTIEGIPWEDLPIILKI